MVETVRKIGPGDLAEAAGTEGIRRWLAASGEGFWAGIAETAPDVASGWHHHDGHHTLVYVLEGKVRIEWGPEGRHHVEAGPGEFLHIPAHTIHRELNPVHASGRAVVIRLGEGETVVNVDGPGG